MDRSETARISSYPEIGDLAAWHQHEAKRAAMESGERRQPQRRLRLLAEERMHRDCLELAHLHHRDLQPSALDSSILADQRYG